MTAFSEAHVGIPRRPLPDKSKTAYEVRILTPESTCNPSQVATINEENATQHAAELFQLATWLKKPKAWALKTWLKGVAAEHLIHKLAEPPKVTTNKFGKLIAVFETNDPEPKYFRFLVDPENSDECRIAGIETQCVNPKLIKKNHLGEGIIWKAQNGTMNYGTFLDIIISTINPWGEKPSPKTPPATPTV